MSFLPNSPWRGCASNFPQPVNATDQSAAQCLVETVYYFNTRQATHPVADVVYRSGNRESDTTRHVFRWDATGYQEVFLNGFRARRQEGTPDDVFYNLDLYVHGAGRPLDSRRPTRYAFISTTLSSGWHPTVTEETLVYRYEIYAPGGIWVAETLEDRYRYPAQDEIAFVAGIAPQYIRSAQLFRLTPDGRHTRRERASDALQLNMDFDPQRVPPRELNIRYPVLRYRGENGQMVELRRHRIWPTHANVSKRSEAPAGSGTRDSDWYIDGVAKVGTYIDAAFRASAKNEAYIFMKDKYVLINYAPGSDGWVVNGPLPICEGYPSLRDTAFAEHGIDCAFGCHKGHEAFIFSSNLCARIDYAPGTTDDKILKGPTTIAAMFPFFKGTPFESGVDAAFESTKENEAYLFKANQYARINYSPDHARLITMRLISQGFNSLRNTKFESGIFAAFASHKTDEAYLFKEDSYARINFAPGTTNDHLIGGGVKKILPNWPSLRGILPLKNYGLDVHDHATPDPPRDHDEL